MNLLLLHLVLLSAILTVAARQVLPRRFYGRYILDHSVIEQGKPGDLLIDPEKNFIKNYNTTFSSNYTIAYRARQIFDAMIFHYIWFKFVQEMAGSARCTRRKLHLRRSSPKWVIHIGVFLSELLEYLESKQPYQMNTSNHFCLMLNLQSA